MTKYTEKEVREAAEWNRQNRVNSKEAEMLTAYADRLAAQSGWVTLGVGDGSGNLFVYGPYDAIKECQRRMLAAQPVAVPDGYRLVPILPDEDMFIAGMEADCLGRPSVDDETHVRSIWDAMLAAAPSPAAALQDVPLEIQQALSKVDRFDLYEESPAAEGEKPPTVFHNCKWYKDSPPPGVVVTSEPAEGAKVAQPAEVLSDAKIDEIVVEVLGLGADQDAMQEFARAIERAVLAQTKGVK